jgi:serine/threonine protein kinase
VLGRTISHYRILEKLGQGGQGEVYLAEDTTLGRKVALKFLGPSLSGSADARRRFQREARAAAGLSHPNIATLHDAGEDGDRQYLVFEYVEGRTLRDILREEPMPVEEVARVGRAIADGLADAHSRGIVHRDMKSANVMLSNEGAVKILDFGLARHEDATQITVSGTTLGTIGYMSPEQVQGDVADARSDLWGLGVVLYECLTGQLPFPGNSAAATMQKILHEDPLDPARLRTDLPAELSRSILDCLQKDPSRRPNRAEAVSVELAPLETGIVTSNSGVPAGSSSPSSPLRSMPMAIAGLMVATLVATMFAYLGPDRGSPRSSQAEQVLAVVDFENLSSEEDPVSGAMFTHMVHTSIIENAPCRVKDLAHLRDVRRRLFAQQSGRIEGSHALEIAREADATHALLGSLGQESGLRFAMWSLVDTRTGDAVAAGRVQSGNISSLADSTVSKVLQHLNPEGAREAPRVPAAELTSDDPRAREWFYRGRVAEADFRQDDATRAYEYATTIDSTFALAFLEYSLSLGTSPGDRRQEQLAAADRAWELRPRLGSRDILRLEAWRYRLAGRNAEAIATYQKIVDRWPDDRIALYDLINLVFARWDMRRTLQIAHSGLELYPDDRPFLRLRRRALGSLGESEQLLELAHREIREYEADAELLVQISDAHRLAARPDSAEHYARRADELEPDPVALRHRLAECAYAQGDLDRSISLYEETRESLEADSRQKYDALLRLIELLMDAGRSVQAGESLAQLRNQWQERPPGRPLAALWLIRFGRPADVLELEFEDNYGALRARTLTLAALDSTAGAESAAAELESRAATPDGQYMVHVRLVRAQVALTQGDPERALGYIENFSQRGWDPWEILFRELEVDALRQAGRFKEAAGVLQAFLRRFGGRARERLVLAGLLEQLGRNGEAANEYERFLDQWKNADPDRPELAEARARLAALRS